MTQIFDLQDTGPSVQSLSTGFLKEVNLKFDQNLQEAYDGIQRFWYRNKDENGNPSLTGTEPSGIQLLQAMGNKAEGFLVVAYARVQMLIGIEQALGLSGLVDMSKVAAPYDMTFTAEGALDTYELRQ